MNCNSTTAFGRGVTANVGECGLNVTLLPHNKYTRHCRGSPITPTKIVAHCRVKQGRSSEKAKWIVEAGLWDVDDSVD